MSTTKCTDLWHSGWCGTYTDDVIHIQIVSTILVLAYFKSTQFILTMFTYWHFLPLYICILKLLKDTQQRIFNRTTIEKSQPLNITRLGSQGRGFGAWPAASRGLARPRLAAAKWPRVAAALPRGRGAVRRDTRTVARTYHD